MPAIGALLAGKYRVLAQLGEGGMGAVFRAENVLTGKQVALKWMHAHLAQNPEASHRFLREARTASSLMHPNVVDVYDVVQDDTTLCLVMELLEGETLRDYLMRVPQPETAEYLSLLLPAMAGVAAAHERGIVHRDLKPDNIFLARTPGIAQVVPKVVDFGIAKFNTNEISSLTQTGAAIGTPMYMSLEQLRGDRDVDGRADVFAFGVMLYQGFTGRTPFGATTLAELAIRVATTDPEPVRTFRSDLPEALAQVVDRAVARDREHRWSSLPALMRALAPFQSGQTSSSSSTGTSRPNLSHAMSRPWPRSEIHNLSAERRATPSSDTLAARELPQSGGLPRALPIWIAAAGLFLVASIGVVLYLRAGNESADSRPHADATETDRRASTSTSPDQLPRVTPPTHTDPSPLPSEDIVPNTERMPPETPPQQQRPTEITRPYSPPDAPQKPVEVNNTGRRRRPRPQPTYEPTVPMPERQPVAKPSERSPADVLGF